MKTVIKHIGSRDNVKASVEILRRGMGPFTYKDEGELISIEKAALAFAKGFDNAFKVNIYATGAI